MKIRASSLVIRFTVLSIVVTILISGVAAWLMEWQVEAYVLGDAARQAGVPFPQTPQEVAALLTPPLVVHIHEMQEFIVASVIAGFGVLYAVLFTVVRSAAKQLAQQHQALKKSEARFRSIFQHSNDAIFVIDPPNDRIIDVNPQACRLLGYGNEELIALPVSAVHPAEMPRFMTFAQSVTHDGHGWTDELTCLTRTGQVLPAEMSASRFELASQSYLLVLVRDISERKRAEESLRDNHRRLEAALAESTATAHANAQLYRELQAAHEALKVTQERVIQQERLQALGEMASGVAHDLNNALAPVVGFSELLMLVPGALPDNGRTRQYLELIHTGAQDAASVVRRLSQFYRQRRAEEPLAPVDVNRLVEQAIALTQPRWKDQAQAAGSIIAVRSALNSVPVVMGDEAALREALTNLIFNAVDALSNGGTIIVRTRAGRGHVVLEVVDDGAGMTEEVRQRCLEPFYSTKDERGTGLGLAMVHGIVERHGGDLAIESAVGAGTTVRLCLPIEARPPEKATAPPLTERRPPRPLHVLVIDDEPVVRQTTAAYLQTDGHTAVVAGSGREGIERFDAGRFDAVITDRAMPDMSGDQVAAAIKRLAPAIPVFLLTGFGDVMTAVGERPDHVDGILSKPVTLARLRAALATVTASVAGGETEATEPARREAHAASSWRAGINPPPFVLEQKDGGLGPIGAWPRSQASGVSHAG
ncbi:MAG: PAS domain S-box protein [Chloroflexi bacterium]|nr:PAS domain S-box protein [Chloroflexota bacterium]